MSTTDLTPTASPLAGGTWLADLDETEERCRRYLEELRWPDGPSCPRCDCDSIGTIPARRRYYCRACKHHFSVTSGTVLHNSHLPIWKWFLAIEAFLRSKDGLPANRLVELLGGSYKTAWFVEHRIRAALCEAAGRPSRSQVHRADRTYERSLVGLYHQLGLRYLPAYQAESDWRARQDGNPHAFRETLLALVRAEPVPYEELVGAAARPRVPV